ncbi:MAG: TetR/AcrR family transcriptional regulator [Clostridiaceae bacterium]
MAKITKGEQSKNRIIEAAAGLFLRQGYNATGINDILAVTGLPKGSFYHHFASKKDLAIEVSVYFDNKIGNWILKTSQGKEWEVFVNDLISEMILGAENSKHFGCPFAVLGLEIAFSEPTIAEYYSKSIIKLKDIFHSVFRFSGVPEENLSIITNRAFALYEGYLLIYRISKNIDNLRIMQNDLINVYKSFKEVKL